MAGGRVPTGRMKLSGPDGAHNHNLRISGGGEGSNYSISPRYYAEDGIQLASAVERYNIRINSDFELGRFIRIGEALPLPALQGRIRFTWQGNPWDVTLITSPLMRIHNDSNKGGFEGPQIGYEYTTPDGETIIVSNTGFNDKPRTKGTNGNRRPEVIQHQPARQYLC
jgi:hypothetical protein